MDAHRAYQLGLVQGLAATRADLVMLAESAVAEVEACAPLAVEAIKRLVRTGRDLPVPEHYELLDAPAREIAESNDVRKGIRAFAEKRQPAWTRS